jgi:hypothetical protein
MARLGGMPRHDLPTADGALLAYLLSVIAIVATFALLVSWLLGPKVLTNTGLAGFENERRPRVARVLRPADFDMEQSAVAIASQENEKQGLRAEARQVAQSSLASKLASTKVGPGASKVAQVTQTRSKPKRVAIRGHRPNYAYVPAPRNAWAYAPNGGGHGSFGGFSGFGGGWFR